MKQNARNVKDDIADAFVTEFNRYGPKLTLDGVTAIIHISKKTIYKYFSSKQDIYRYILGKSSAYVREKQIEICDNPDLSIREKLEKIITIATPIEMQLDVARINELKTEEPEVFQEIVRAYEDQWLPVKEVISQAINEGVVRSSCTPNFIVSVLYASMTDFLRGPFLKTESLSYTEAVRRLSDLLLNGILVNE
ncbi:MAG: TetR/AcrR family transcriptional regulator [Bacilli bacterium]|nr:TetR/AcrR family transcriptional regulator [Bacilli bacterium]